MSNVKKPEPVAWRTYRSKRWCFAYSPNRKLCQCDSDWQGLITTEQAEAYKDACVREALEQAAAAVERHDKKGREFVKGSLWDQLSKEASDRIRALIPNTEAKT